MDKRYSDSYKTIGTVMDKNTETSPYKSDPRFAPNIYIVKMGEIWGRNQNDFK